MVNTKTVVLRNQDADGNVNVLYPRTHIDCVEGAADLEAKADGAVRFDIAQALTQEQQLQVLLNLGLNNIKTGSSGNLTVLPSLVTINLYDLFE